MNLGLGERLRLAWRIATSAKAAATLVPTWQDGEPVYSDVSFEGMVRHGWRKNELIFACVAKTAASASFVRLDVKAGDGEQLDDHPLRRLIKQPNPFMDEYDLWYSVVVFQKLAGGAYFEKERDRAGRVIRLWPLRPDWVRPVRSGSEFIGGYEFGVPGRDKVTLAARDVLDFKLFDPLNHYRGFAPAAVAGRVGDVDNATTDYLKLFMEKGGMPPGLLKTKQKLADTDVSDIRRRWGERYGGIEHWLSPAVLDQDAEYQQTGLSFKDMGFEMLDARAEARICMVLDVPPILVGAKVGLDRATYSNYAEARQAWWEDSLTPLYRNFESVIVNDLGREFGGVEAAFDLSAVPAFREQTDALYARANEGVGRGYMTVNEARRLIGLEEAPAGDVFLRPNSAIEVGLNGQPAAVDEPGDGGKAKAGQTDAAALAVAEMDFKARRADNDEERRAFEAKLRRRLEGYFEGQLERIEEAVGERYQPVTIGKGAALMGSNGTANH
jgi:HK97 family phage portal protein